MGLRVWGDGNGTKRNGEHCVSLSYLLVYGTYLLYLYYWHPEYNNTTQVRFVCILGHRTWFSLLDTLGY
jgi:hypothetical protein